MKDNILCVGPEDQALGEALARLTNIPDMCVSRRVFPDGEICIRFPEPVDHRRVFVIKSTHPPQERRLMELFQMVEVAAYQRASEIVCIVPYLAYSRQDRRTREGEPESGRMVLNTLSMLGADRLVTVDVHNPEMLEKAPFPSHDLSSLHLFDPYFKGMDLLHPTIVSPDRGGESRARRAAEIMGFPVIVLNKNKDEDGTTWYEHERLEIEGRDMVILDDLCSSGSTLVPLARFLKKNGAREIFYNVTHFFADGDWITEKAGFPIHFMATDTVPSAWSRLPVAPLLADWIEQHLSSERESNPDRNSQNEVSL